MNESISKERSALSKSHVKRKCQHHLSKHEEVPKSLQCDVCLGEFSSAAALRRHRKYLHRVTIKDIVSYDSDNTGTTDIDADCCGKGVKQKVKMEGGVRITPKQRHHCDQCSTTFRSKYMIGKHKCSDTTFRCDECGKRYKSRGRYERHLVIHNNTLLHKCSYCCEPCSSEESLSKHLADLHHKIQGNRRAVVSVKMTRQKGIMKKHNFLSDTVVESVKVKTEPSEQSNYLYPCTVCKQTFVAMSHLKRHMLSHTDNPKTFCCNHCGIHFTREDTMKRHIASRHTKEHDEKTRTVTRAEECTIISTKLEGSDSERTHHMENGETREVNLYNQLTCPKCFKTFLSSSHLRRHILVHVKNAYNCPKCSKQFHRADTLKRHYVVIHHPDLRYNATPQQILDAVSELSLPSIAELLEINGLVPCKDKKLSKSPRDMQYECQQCGEKFKWSTALRKHLSTHGELDKYMCEICGKCFRRPGLLRYHMANHDKFESRLEKNKDLVGHVCKICSRVFLNAYKLQRHAVTHSRERLYRCEVCDGRYTRADTLKRHRECMHDLFDKCEYKAEASKTDKSVMIPEPDGMYTMKNVKRTQINKNDTRQRIQCYVCDKICLGKTHYNEHLKTHKGVKRLPCNVCGRRFKTELGLRSHIAIHESYTGEYAYIYLLST